MFALTANVWYHFRSAPGFASQQRNFSFIPSISASAGTATAATAATQAVSATEKAVPLEIPEIPAPTTDGIIQELAANGEPTFASLGLGGYSPIGLLQNALEFMHVSCDLPWYATIALSTVLIRIMLTPLVVIAQRNAAIMRNVMPEMQEVQTRMTEARAMGNAMEYSMANQELMALMKSRGFNPLKNMLIPFAQMPIFLSYFIGIRRMVNAPVESLHTGGLAWFQDLTLADPYYVLPIVTSATLWATIQLGTETARVPGQDSPMLILVLKAMPIVIFPFIMNFPAAMVVYWASSNFCSLIQVIYILSKCNSFKKIFTKFLNEFFQGMIFKMPKVRTFFNIPQLLNHPTPQAKKKQSVVQNMKGGNSSYIFSSIHTFIHSMFLVYFSLVKFENVT